MIRWWKERKMVKKNKKGNRISSQIHLVLGEKHPHLTRVYFGLLYALVSLLHSTASNEICIRMKAHANTHLSRSISCENTREGSCVRSRWGRIEHTCLQRLLWLLGRCSVNGCLCGFVWYFHVSTSATDMPAAMADIAWQPAGAEGKRCASERQYHCSICKTKLTIGSERETQRGIRKSKRDLKGEQWRYLWKESMK